MRVVAAILLGFSLLSYAKDKPTITITVVNSESGQRAFTYTSAGTAAKSSTTCDTSGTATDYGYGTTGVSASTNCTTTTTPGTPPEVHTNYIAQEYVYAILPNGNHVKLWCQAGFRRCDHLQPGQYQAEISGGNSIFVYGIDLAEKKHKIKYKVIGGF